MLEVEQVNPLTGVIPPLPKGRIKLEVWNKQLPIPDIREPGWYNHVTMPGRELVAFTDEEMNSFTRNFFNWYMSQMQGINANTSGSLFQDAELNFRNWVGTVSTTGAIPQGGVETTASQGYRGLVDEDDEGIRVGTGSVAFDFDHWGVSGLSDTNHVKNGTGAGQLSHVQSELTQRSWLGPGSRQWQGEYARFFNNNSGGTITVREVTFNMQQSSSTANRMMVARDVLGTPIPVNTGGQLLVTYTLLGPIYEGP